MTSVTNSTNCIACDDPQHPGLCPQSTPGLIAVYESGSLTKPDITVFRKRHRVWTIVAALAAVFAASARAQEPVVTLHQFKMPVGLWTNTATATIPGQPTSSPITTTECGGGISAAQLANITKAMRLPAANCTSTVKTDTPTLAVYERDCPIEWHVATTLTKIDNRHYTTDTRFTQGQISSITHIDSHYNGPCTATVVAQPMMPEKPSPEACAEISTGYDELTKARTACDSMEEEAARCRVRVDSELKRLQIQIALCKE